MYTGKSDGRRHQRDRWGYSRVLGSSAGRTREQKSHLRWPVRATLRTLCGRGLAYSFVVGLVKRGDASSSPLARAKRG